MHTISQQYNSLPRKIPFASKLFILIFNSKLALSIAFIGMGFISMIIVSQSINFKSYFVNESSLITTQGVITNVSIANSGKKNNRKSWEVNFTFKDKTETAQTGVCFSYNEMTVNDSVKILFKENEPSVSKIEGTEFNQFALWIVGILLLFPIGGIIVLVKHIKNCLNNFNTLANGILTKGKVINKIATGARVNKKPVYKITFEFKDTNNNIVQSIITTTKVERLEDELEEYIVYLADSVQSAIVLDSLPKSVRRYFETNG